MLIPNVRRTWAPRGQTPFLRHSQDHDRLSTIAALSVSPKRQRLGLYVEYHAENITGMEILAFLRNLLFHLRGPVVLLWDGGSIHRRREVVAWIRKQKRLRIYRFPAYAPELNPAEFVWTTTKRDLSNSTHACASTLHAHLRRRIQRMCQSQRLLCSCIHASDLPWKRRGR